jgi:predicted nucleic acid-binding protein
VIYLDSSIVLAGVLAEDRRPAAAFWLQPFISSRLLHYEVFNRLHARAVDEQRAADAHALVQRISLVDLAPDNLARALEPFPVPVRTLDALHLATMDFLRAQGLSFELASYDRRLSAAAQALGFALAEI